MHVDVGSACVDIRPSPKMDVLVSLLSTHADRQGVDISNFKSNLFATKQMNNLYSKARNMSTGHKGSFKTALTSALIIQIINNITK